MDKCPWHEKGVMGILNIHSWKVGAHIHPQATECFKWKNWMAINTRPCRPILFTPGHFPLSFASLKPSDSICGTSSASTARPGLGHCSSVICPSGSWGSKYRRCMEKNGHVSWTFLCNVPTRVWWRILMAVGSKQSRHHSGTEPFCHHFGTQNAAYHHATTNETNIRLIDKRSTLETSCVPKRSLYQKKGSHEKCSP